MSRANRSSTSHLSGYGVLSQGGEKKLRDKLAADGLCDCRQNGADDCCEHCPVRKFVRSTSGWLFHAKAEFKFASPKERAANLQTVINGLNSTINALEPAELEGRSEDLQLLDEETLRYFGQNHLEIENFSYDSSTLIVFLKQLVRVAKSEKKKLLDMDRAPPRLPNKIPVKEIMECWKVQFGELPSTYPESTFAEIIADLRGDDVTPDALAQELKRARESILKQRKNKFVPMLFLFT